MQLIISVAMATFQPTGEAALNEDTLLLSCGLFTGMTAAQLHSFLETLRPKRRAFSQGETLLHLGSVAQSIGILLEGRAEAQKVTPGGGCFTVARLGEGSVYGDILIGGGAQSPVGITALAPCRVLLIWPENPPALATMPAPPAHDRPY